MKILVTKNSCADIGSFDAEASHSPSRTFSWIPLVLVMEEFNFRKMKKVFRLLLVLGDFVCSGDDIQMIDQCP